MRNISISIYVDPAINQHNECRYKSTYIFFSERYAPTAGIYICPTGHGVCMNTGLADVLYKYLNIPARVRYTQHECLYIGRPVRTSGFGLRPVDQHSSLSYYKTEL